MDRELLMKQFNKQPRIGTLATADDQGKVDNAVFSALQMIDENTVVMAIGNNRSYTNLKLNPQAAFIFFEPAESPYDWQGARIYLEVTQSAEAGPHFDQMVAIVRQMAGDQAADNVKAAITFKIVEARPLIDMTG